MNARRTILAASCLAVVLSACGINEMPSHKNQISAIQIAPEIDSSAEVIFAAPYGVDPGDPNDVAIDVMEERIRERLAERLDRLAHPSLLSQPFESALVDRFDQVFPWTLVRIDEPYDALFRIDVRHYGIDVDEGGLASVFYEIGVQALFAPTGTVIYDQSVHSAMAMTEIYEGYDPVSDAAARTMNLLALDELSDAEFQGLVFEGARWAVRDLVDELFDDTYQD